MDLIHAMKNGKARKKTYSSPGLCFETILDSTDHWPLSTLTVSSAASIFYSPPPLGGQTRRASISKNKSQREIRSSHNYYTSARTTSNMSNLLSLDQRHKLASANSQDFLGLESLLRSNSQVMTENEPEAQQSSYSRPSSKRDQKRHSFQQQQDRAHQSMNITLNIPTSAFVSGVKEFFEGPILSIEDDSAPNPRKRSSSGLHQDDVLPKKEKLEQGYSSTRHKIGANLLDDDIYHVNSEQLMKDVFISLSELPKNDSSHDHQRSYPAEKTERQSQRKTTDQQNALNSEKYFTEDFVKEGPQARNFFIAGRGGETNFHPGNQYIRPLILQHVQDYLQASPSQRGKKYALHLLETLPELSSCHFVVQQAYFLKNAAHNKISQQFCRSVYKEHGVSTFQEFRRLAEARQHQEQMDADDSKDSAVLYWSIGQGWAVGLISNLLRSAAAKVQLKEHNTKP